MRISDQLAKLGISGDLSEDQEEIKPVTLEDLLNMEGTEEPKLLDPIILQIGLAGIIGSSDTGKSCLARQLCLHLIDGKEEFLGFPLNSIHKKAIYVTTEDGKGSTSSAFKRMLSQSECSNPSGLRFVFEHDELPKQLDRMLSEEPADLVVIDAYLDVAPLESNQASHTRQVLHQYRTLTNKFNTLILFVHHTGKASKNSGPGKHGAVGSQSWEAKLRAVIELRTDTGDPYKKHLCVVKANGVSQEYKNSSFLLEFDEDTLSFINTGERVDFEDLHPDAEPNGGCRKGFDPYSIPESQHQAWVNAIFAKENRLGYGEMSQGLKDVSGLGMNKITTKGTLITYYLKSGKMVKNGKWYTPPSPF